MSTAVSEFSYSQLNVVPVENTRDKEACTLLDESAQTFGRVASSSRIQQVMRKRNTKEIDLELVRRIDDDDAAPTPEEKKSNVKKIYDMLRRRRRCLTGG